MIAPIRPSRHSLFFGYRELPRLCLDFLRGAKVAVKLGRLVEYIIAVKGLTVDHRARKQIANSIRSALIRMEHRSTVRRILEEPDTWWELAVNGS